MANNMRDGDSVIGSGPVKRRRLAAALFVPMSVGLDMARRDMDGNSKFLALALLAILAAAGTYRALRMSIAHAGEQLIVKNFFLDKKFQISEIAAARWKKPFQPGFASVLQLVHKDGTTTSVSGVSIWTNIFSGDERWTPRRTKANQAS